MDTNSELLNKRIEENLKALPDLEATAREKRVKELESLYKLRIEEMKTETEARQKGAEHMDAMCQAQAEAKERKINFGARLAFDALSLGLQLAAYSCFIKAGFKFEETGTFCSKTFRDVTGGFMKFIRK